MTKLHKYIITGATGKIGTELLKTLKSNNFMVITRSPEKLGKSVRKYVADLSRDRIKDRLEEYDIVIHLAAETHINKCEEDRARGRQSSAWINNVIATQNLSEYCSLNHKKLIMLSTESVFGGNKSIYSENDKPDPISWYGITKLKSEEVVKKNVRDYVILRTVMAYGGESGKKDLPRFIMEKLKNREKVKLSTDQRIAFTYVGDIVKALLLSSSTNIRGVYHFCGPTVLTPFELGNLIVRKFKFDEKLIIPVTAKELFGLKGTRLRLRNAVLTNKKFIGDTSFTSFTDIEHGLKLLL